MATFRLSAQEATEVQLAQIDIVIDPKAEWNQTAPHAYVRLSVGNTVEGVFQKFYDKELRFEGAEFMPFIMAFQDLDTRFFQFLVDSGKIQGSMK